MKFLHLKNRPQQEKTALVLSGGGSRGSYQVGVIKGLKKLNIKYDMVVGTSAGALNAAMIAMGTPEIAEQLWLSTASKEIFDLDTEMPEIINTLKNKLHIEDEIFGNLSLPPDQFVGYARDIISNGGVTGDGMKHLIDKYISEDKIRKSPLDFGLVTVEYPSMNGYKLMKEDIPKGQLRQYIQASASCFPFMQYCEIDDKKFIDGGFCDNLPVSMALNKGAKRIIAVDLEAVGKVHEKDLELAEKTTEFYHIKSRFDLGNFLNFDPQQAIENIHYGYLDTLKAFHKLDGIKYFFKKDTIPAPLIPMADSCADVFHCDRNQIYTESMLLDELKMKVLDAQVALKKSPFTHLSIQNIQNPSILKRRIFSISKKLNKRAMTVYIAENILEKGKESFFYHVPLLEIFSREIMAAEYIISRKLLNK